MAQPITPDYGQQFLFPPALEDWASADHPARFLREFVDQLDLPALGFALAAAVAGRPPYAPSLPLKIWLYVPRLGSKTLWDIENRDTLCLFDWLPAITPRANPLALPKPALCRWDKFYRWATVPLFQSENKQCPKYDKQCPICV